VIKTPEKGLIDKAYLDLKSKNSFFDTLLFKVGIPVMTLFGAILTGYFYLKR